MENKDLGIFQNQDDVAENIKKSAEAIGIDINENAVDKLKDGQPFEVFVAKKNCKMCNGQGTVSFVPNRRNTRRREEIKDGDWREENMVKALCKCVKRRLE